MTEVVAALIFSDDKFMICKRPESKARGGLWEFVGGKVEPGETKERALVRECREELGIEIAVGGALTDVTHEYPDITIRLTLFRCLITAGTPVLLEHSDLRFISPDETGLYEFCPADTGLLEYIRENRVMIHQMRLNRAPFDMIKSGHKTIELRLYDEKRGRIKPGDEIIFVSADTSGETLRAKVEALYIFPTFRELYEKLPLNACGYTRENLGAARAEDMNEYYSEEEQRKCGVVGIKIKTF